MAEPWQIVDSHHFSGVREPPPIGNTSGSKVKNGGMDAAGEGSQSVCVSQIYQPWWSRVLEMRWSLLFLRQWWNRHRTEQAAQFIHGDFEAYVERK